MQALVEPSSALLGMWIVDDAELFWLYPCHILSSSNSFVETMYVPANGQLERELDTALRLNL
jgi:hypothetical protein